MRNLTENHTDGIILKDVDGSYKQKGEIAPKSELIAVGTRASRTHYKSSENEAENEDSEQRKTHCI